VSRPIHHFGPEAASHGQKKGGSAEAGRPIGDLMESISTTTNIPQSIATTVTVFDDKERRRREAEIARAQTWIDGQVARGRREVFSEAVTVTPIIADLLLKKNPDNRNLLVARLADIRADLENGAWVFNGESIVISKDGLINDGQHRLVACRDSGVSLRTMMVFGVPRSTRLTVDQGTARSAANYLEMSGDRNGATVIAAVARLLWQHVRYGEIDFRQSNTKRRQPTKGEILNVVAEKRASLTKSIARADKLAKQFGSKSLIAFCHYVFAQKDEEAADLFISRFLDGVALSKGNPIHELRQRILLDPKMPQRQRLEMIFRAWNAYRQGREVTYIRTTGRLPSLEG
jgi:hypothetical protein